MEKEIVERRALVARLSAEGLSSSRIAEQMGISARTVRRDREAVRREASMSRGERLIEEQVAGMIMESQRAVARLRRLANKEDGPLTARVEAEWRAWLACDRLAERLQKMGYLPNAAREVHAKLTHRVEKTASLIEASARVVEFEKILTEAGRMDDKARAEIAALKGEIVREAVGDEAEAR